MKKMLIALVAVLTIAAQIFTPVAAASLAGGSACGDTYTVSRGDYLSRIARDCGMALSEVLALNPQIVNPNIIYPGQIIRLSWGVPIPSWPSYSGSTSYPSGYPATSSVGNARVSVSTTRAVAGSNVTVTISGFPANADIDYRIGLRGEQPDEIIDGVVNSNGAASQVITIPGYANVGEYWVIRVLTTSQTNVVSVVSPAIYISSSYPSTSYSGNARVSLSTTSARVGNSITVSASGFPANTDVDFRLGKSGEEASVVYDGFTNSSGSASQSVTIPGSANVGETWVVLVLTTNIKNGVQVTSQRITIIS